MARGKWIGGGEPCGAARRWRRPAGGPAAAPGLAPAAAAPNPGKVPVDALDVIVALVGLNGGRVVGSAPLHWQACLADCSGAGLRGIGFIHRSFGPWSFEVDAACRAAVRSGRIGLGRAPARHGTACPVFETSASPAPAGLGRLGPQAARALVGAAGRVPARALGLAATAALLDRQGALAGRSASELGLRRSLAATDAGLGEAAALLRAVGLDGAARLLEGGLVRGRAGMAPPPGM